MENKHYRIKYHAMSTTGNVRKNNEDNLLCDGHSRDVNDEEDFSYYGEILSEDSKILAVFDGMGGGEQGEVASSMATDVARNYNFGDESKSLSEHILECAKEMNNKVHTYAEENQLEHMGTTFAGIVFGKNEIYIGNVGDSRIYKVRNGKIEQLSVDHVLPEELKSFKNIITQYVGMGEEEKEFSPALSTEEYCNGDRYIICSDGLTEKLNDEEVGVLCHVAQSVTDASDILVSQALGQGSNDNITVIVCELEELTS